MSAAAVSEIRREMRDQLALLVVRGELTPCQDDPIPYTEIRQTAEEAEYLCAGCPVITTCFLFGKAEGINNDGMIYGGKSWRLGRVVDTRRNKGIGSKYK